MRGYVLRVLGSDSGKGKAKRKVEFQASPEKHDDLVIPCLFCVLSDRLGAKSLSARPMKH